MILILLLQLKRNCYQKYVNTKIDALIVVYRLIDRYKTAMLLNAISAAVHKPIINKRSRGMSSMLGQLKGLQQKYKRLITNLTIICIVVLITAKSY